MVVLDVNPSSKAGSTRRDTHHPRESGESEVESTRHHVNHDEIEAVPETVKDEYKSHFRQVRIDVMNLVTVPRWIKGEKRLR